MRGYFGVGVERISKSMNAGAIFRTAHAFGASFVYTVAAQYKRPKGALADTSKALGHLPFYGFANHSEMILPEGCRLVGVELTDEAIDIRSFRHPSRCAYILGPERGSLSDEMVEKCEFVIKIPTRFCINVSVAAAMVLYDRSLSMGRYGERPVRAGGPHSVLKKHQHGGPILRRLERFRANPPIGKDFDPHGFSS